MELGIASVGAITVICYLGGMAVKAKMPTIKNDYIPVVCGTLGGVLGVVGFLTKMANFPAKDIITAIAVGIVSGLAATGVNQIVKINSSDKDEVKTDE